MRVECPNSNRGRGSAAGRRRVSHGFEPEAYRARPDDGGKREWQGRGQYDRDAESLLAAAVLRLTNELGVPPLPRRRRPTDSLRPASAGRGIQHDPSARWPLDPVRLKALMETPKRRDRLQTQAKKHQKVVPTVPIDVPRSSLPTCASRTSTTAAMERRREYERELAAQRVKLLTPQFPELFRPVRK